MQITAGRSVAWEGEFGCEEGARWSIVGRWDEELVRELYK